MNKKSFVWTEWVAAAGVIASLIFVGYEIRQGNALIGATPAMMQNGIPNEAFDAIEGDDVQVAKRLKGRNRRARALEPRTSSLEPLLSSVL